MPCALAAPYPPSCWGPGSWDLWAVPEKASSFQSVTVMGARRNPQGLGAAMDHVKPSALGPAPSFGILESCTVWSGGDRPEHVHSPSLPRRGAREAEDLRKATEERGCSGRAAPAALSCPEGGAPPAPLLTSADRSEATAPPSAPHSCLVGLVTAPTPGRVPPRHFWAQAGFCASPVRRCRHTCNAK